jgi:hypothetical protein
LPNFWLPLILPSVVATGENLRLIREKKSIVKEMVSLGSSLAGGGASASSSSSSSAPASQGSGGHCKRILHLAPFSSALELRITDSSRTRGAVDMMKQGWRQLLLTQSNYSFFNKQGQLFYRC